MRPQGGDTQNLEVNVTFQAKLLIDRIVLFGESACLLELLDNLQLLCDCKSTAKDFSNNILKYNFYFFCLCIFNIAQKSQSEKFKHVCM